MRRREQFPFTEAEWEAVREAARDVLHATLADDAVPRASRFIEPRDVLARLRERHGEHPAVLEAEADFTDDAAERAALYERARQLAGAHGLQTFTVRLSRAGVP